MNTRIEPGSCTTIDPVTKPHVPDSPNPTESEGIPGTPEVPIPYPVTDLPLIPDTEPMPDGGPAPEGPPNNAF